MKYKVIDNFLDEAYFESLVTLFIEDPSSIPRGNSVMPWFFSLGIVEDGVVEDNLFYMAHMLYAENTPMSAHYQKIIPLLEKLDTTCLIRAKANFFPNTHTLHEHAMHVDMDFSHSGAILSLNTCDGYTKLEDGTKINSVANRLLLFDSSKKHCSTTTTNVPARINLNINYIQEQFSEKI